MCFFRAAAGFLVFSTLAGVVVVAVTLGQEPSAPAEKPDLMATYDGVLEKAMDIGKRDIRTCMGKNRCGCRATVPGTTGYLNGVWLCDALWGFDDAIIYFSTPQEATDYLYAETPGNLGVIPFFANLQETAGPYAGNIPSAKYLPGTSGYAGEPSEIDYGGAFDLAYTPRVNHRDDLPAAASFIDAVHRHWKFFNTTEYIKQYFPVMQRHVAFRASWLDADTCLFRSTHNLQDCAIDKAVPRSCAMLRINGKCMQMFSLYAEMARAIGQLAEADKYETLAARMKDGMNKYLWNDAAKRYEIKIFTNVTNNEKSILYGAKEDHRFFVADNMVMIYYGVPDSEVKITDLMTEIEKADGRLKLYGQSVEPPYPDGSYTSIVDGGAYVNGKIWPSISNLYGIALFRLGYPKEAMEVLRRQAAVAIRDNCFCEYYDDDEQGKAGGVRNNNYTAAPYIRSMVEGLFGLDADYASGVVKIHPSLQQSGSLRCQLGLHPLELKMTIGKGKRELSISTTYNGPTDFRVLLEPGATACRVSISAGADVPCSVSKVGNAVYVFFKDALHGGTTVYRLASSAQ